MPPNAARIRKLGERIAQIVAEMLEHRIKDPRLGFVTITEARVTGDLREATVFYTVFGSEAEQADTAAALASATGVIRSEVGRQTGIKHTPSIAFQLDKVPDTAAAIEDAVARARAADAAVAAARAGAVPAGDPDPYRSTARPATMTTKTKTMRNGAAPGRAARWAKSRPTPAGTRDTRPRDPWLSRYPRSRGRVGPGPQDHRRRAGDLPGLPCPARCRRARFDAGRGAGTGPGPAGRPRPGVLRRRAV